MSNIDPCSECGTGIDSEEVHGGYAGDKLLCVPCMIKYIETMAATIEERDAEIAALKADNERLRKRNEDTEDRVLRASQVLRQPDDGDRLLGLVESATRAIARAESAERSLAEVREALGRDDPANDHPVDGPRETIDRIRCALAADTEPASTDTEGDDD